MAAPAPGPDPRAAEFDRLRRRLRQARETLASRRRARAWHERTDGMRAFLGALLRGEVAEGADWAPPPRPPRRRRARPRSVMTRPEVLAWWLASGRATSGEVAALLRVDPRDVPASASGRVGLPASAWRRVLREVADEGGA